MNPKRQLSRSILPELTHRCPALRLCCICALALIVFAFTPRFSIAQNIDLPHTSASTGVDGPLNISGILGGTYVFDMTAKPDGVWNFTSIFVEEGITVTFEKNDNNTPVVWLATENVQIDGVLNLNGVAGTLVEGQASPGGPGGYAGGLGGIAFNRSNLYAGSAGQGPGGGLPGSNFCAAGGNGAYNGVYGNAFIQPLAGGSGGGGSGSLSDSNGANGGGGGGAILIDSTLDIIVNGTISAIGGGSAINCQFSGTGSGGAIRLVGDRVLGTGNLSVGNGRSRVEGFIRQILANSSAAPSGTLDFGVNQSQLLITDVAGVGVASPPTGDTTNPDVVFSQAGEVTITVTAINIPDGNPVTLRIIYSGLIIALPDPNDPTALFAAQLSGGIATFTATLPAGIGTIQAFSIVEISPQ